ncbi:helix-turn-helix domain-containing protein [Halochromatium salexigens]|uniref:Helix-turn-helix protein n=1 Tax=Halochromatium salexigens TaxID=49447 RepID=A0AAJ0UFK2_HALSE|nr:helix-turn-helix transcriptional regulator [Halochromatium salexigens]MBK5930537.1 hypothetical protein [Halochromatium salexigens]
MIEDKNIGSTLEDFLQGEGQLEEARQIAAKRLLGWQLQEAMKNLHINKVEMAKRMQTSRSQLDRLLDPDNDKVRLDTLNRAAAVLGKRIKLELVENQGEPAPAQSADLQIPPRTAERLDA